MPTINFDIFDKLWKKMEQQFKAENDTAFSLDNLSIALTEKNLPLRSLDFQNVEKRYLKKRNDEPQPQTFKCSNTALAHFQQYAKVESLDTLVDDIEAIIENVNKKPDRSWRFLGREEELQQMNDFLLDENKRLLEISGVPMIGKTALVNHFLERNKTAKQYDVRQVQLTTSSKVEETLFLTEQLNDFESYTKPTIIIIENFEEALEWTEFEIGEEDDEEVHLHDLKKENKGGSLLAFIEKILQSDNLKLILESRFLINFPKFLNYRKFKKNIGKLRLSGLSAEKFWHLYQYTEITKEEFEKICQNFNHHTGLLAFAYENDFVYEDLKQAIHQPQLAQKELWKLVGKLIHRLKDAEIYMLCFLSVLEKSIAFQELFEALQELPKMAKKDEDEMHNILLSLEKKLFVQRKQNKCEINPYLRSVCYVNLQKRTRQKNYGQYMQAVKALPFLQQYGKTPQYNKSYQLFEQNDYIGLLRLGKDFRKERKYEETHEAFKLGLQIYGAKKEVFYNEIGRTFKEEKKYDKAIEVLEKAVSLGNIHSYNELAICYKEQKDFKKAIQLLEKLIEEHNHLPAYNELAICYKAEKDFKKAIEVLEKLIEEHNHLPAYNELAICYKEQKDFKKAIEVLEKAVSLGNIHSYNELAICYKEQKDFKKAIEVLENAIQKFPKDAKLLNELAICYKEQKDFKKAIEVLENAIQKFPKDRVFPNTLKSVRKAAQEARTISIFTAYAAEDEQYKETLHKQLHYLRSKNVVFLDRDAVPLGTNRNKTVEKYLRQASIILLLVSADFLACREIYERELKVAKEQHDKGNICIIPILCRSCRYAGTFFDGIEVLPRSGQFINKQNLDDDALFMEIADEIEILIHKTLA